MESGKFGATSSIPPIKRENKEEKKKKKYELYIVEQKFLYKISYNRRKKKKEREN